MERTKEISMYKSIIQDQAKKINALSDELRALKLEHTKKPVYTRKAFEDLFEGGESLASTGSVAYVKIKYDADDFYYEVDIDTEEEYENWDLLNFDEAWAKYQDWLIS